MRKILVAGALLFVAFIVIHRQRIFLRDPLGKVERNGEIQQGMRLYINYSNDVLIEDVSGNNRYLIEGWSGLPGVPKQLFCLSGLLCWTDADKATVLPLNGAKAGARAAMSAKVVTFQDGSGATIRAQLR